MAENTNDGGQEEVEGVEGAAEAVKVGAGAVEGAAEAKAEGAEDELTVELGGLAAVFAFLSECGDRKLGHKNLSLNPPRGGDFDRSIAFVRRMKTAIDAGLTVETVDAYPRRLSMEDVLNLWEGKSGGSALEQAIAMIRGGRVSSPISPEGAKAYPGVFDVASMQRWKAGDFDGEAATKLAARFGAESVVGSDAAIRELYKRGMDMEAILETHHSVDLDLLLLSLRSNDRGFWDQFLRYGWKFAVAEYDKVIGRQRLEGLGFDKKKALLEPLLKLKGREPGRVAEYAQGLRPDFSYEEVVKLLVVDEGIRPSTERANAYIESYDDACYAERGWNQPPQGIALEMWPLELLKDPWIMNLSENPQIIGRLIRIARKYGVMNYPDPRKKRWETLKPFFDVKNILREEDLDILEVMAENGFSFEEFACVLKYLDANRRKFSSGRDIAGTINEEASAAGSADLIGLARIFSRKPGTPRAMVAKSWQKLARLLVTCMNWQDEEFSKGSFLIGLDVLNREVNFSAPRELPRHIRNSSREKFFRLVVSDGFLKQHSPDQVKRVLVEFGMGVELPNGVVEIDSGEFSVEKLMEALVRANEVEGQEEGDGEEEEVAEEVAEEYEGLKIIF